MWQPDKPSDNENEYFKRKDAEWLKSRRSELDAARATQASAGGLNCPRCAGTLVHRNVEQVTMDVCTSCGGVWLDPGELEMVLHLPKGELIRAVMTMDGR